MRMHRVANIGSADGAGFQEGGGAAEVAARGAPVVHRSTLGASGKVCHGISDYVDKAQVMAGNVSDRLKEFLNLHPPPLA